jgi:predicted Zn-dependent protease
MIKAEELISMNKDRFSYLMVLVAWIFFSAGVINAQTHNKNQPKLKSEPRQEVSQSRGSSETGDYDYAPSSYNYFRIDKTGRSLWNGKHWKPEDYPLSIYVKSNTTNNYKILFRNYVDYALSIWEKADPRIKFKYVSNTRDADIVIIFEENLVEKYDDNYLGITDYKLRPVDKKIQKSFIEIGLLKFNNEPVSDGEVKATIIHELGHALGLGHSDNEMDIMFPFINPFSSSDMHFNELSGGDIEAVKSVVNLGYGFILN